jgi:endonuclease/exonuclease/phosphatase family metal-dependent hydrolase
MFIVALGLVAVAILLYYQRRRMGITQGPSQELSGLNAIKVMAFNSANYDDHTGWETRRGMIVNGILAANPDIICLSEIRFNPDNAGSTSNYQNMAEQLLKDLQATGNYVNASLVVTPFMYYPVYPNNTQVAYACPKVISPDGQTHLWEGLAVITRLKVLQSGAWYMPKPIFGTDNNFRGTQHLSVVLPDGVTTLEVFNTHFGLDEATLSYNAQATLQYMKPYLAAGSPCILVGDMNSDPTDTALQYLTAGGLVDVWPKLYPSVPGYTIPSNAPSERIDYVWGSANVAKGAVSMNLMYTQPDAKTGLFASDHLGLLASFQI